MFLQESFSILRSSNKKNIQYVAAGDYQIEFFSYESCEYFSIYLWQNGRPKIILIRLSEAKIEHASNGIFHVVDGKRKFVLVIDNNRIFNEVSVTQFLWNRFPYRRFSGKVSREGIIVLEQNIAKWVG